MSLEELLTISGVGGASTFFVIILYKIIKKRCSNSSCVSSDTDGISIHIGSPRVEQQPPSPIIAPPVHKTTPIYVRQLRASQNTTTTEDNNLYE